MTTETITALQQAIIDGDESVRPFLADALTEAGLLNEAATQRLLAAVPPMPAPCQVSQHVTVLLPTELERIHNFGVAVSFSPELTACIWTMRQAGCNLFSCGPQDRNLLGTQYDSVTGQNLGNHTLESWAKSCVLYARRHVIEPHYQKCNTVEQATAFRDFCQHLGCHDDALAIHNLLPDFAKIQAPKRVEKDRAELEQLIKRQVYERQKRQDAIMRKFLRCISKTVRAVAGCSGMPWPIEIMAGDEEPHVTGSSWCFCTRGGTVISHPSAYAKSGWSNMVYHASTMAVEVGREWLIAQGFTPPEEDNEA